MSKWQIFKTYLLLNPWIWVLCVTNVFGYLLRIGVDNWAPLYVRETLHFNDADAVNTIFYFEIGALIGGLTLGIVADYCKGRTAAISVICLTMIFFLIGCYKNGTTVMTVNIALFFLGLFIAGALILIHLSIINFVPKKSVSVAYGMAGTFGYLFGDSSAKVGLAAIADPNKTGLTLFGYLLHGWSSVFTILYGACALAIGLLILVAIVEERKIRQLEKAKAAGEKIAAQ